MHLRATVRDDDIDAAIRVMLESFLQSQVRSGGALCVIYNVVLPTQKVSVRRILQKAFQKYISHAEETSMVLMHMLQRLMRDSEMYQVTFFHSHTFNAFRV
jgi:DNA replication licensing factor MCM2